MTSGLKNNDSMPIADVGPITDVGLVVVLGLACLARSLRAY